MNDSHCGELIEALKFLKMHNILNENEYLIKKEMIKNIAQIWKRKFVFFKDNFVDNFYLKLRKIQKLQKFLTLKMIIDYR